MRRRALSTSRELARFDAYVFDKDGTLLDFGATWHAAIHAGILHAAAGDASKASDIASALGFDLALRAAAPSAPVVHAGNDELVALLRPHLAGGGARALMDDVLARALGRVVEEPGASRTLERLREHGVPVAVATNDDEAAAAAQLAALGWLGGEGATSDAPPLIERARVFGCDSGHGAKPAPGMLLAAAAAVGVPAARCAMVGDAMTDLVGARRAGFGAAILVGGDEVAEYAPHADFWIRDLAQLLPRGAGSL